MSTRLQRAWITAVPLLFMGMTLEVVTSQAEKGGRKTLAGTVTTVHAASGLLRIKTAAGAMVEMIAPTELLRSVRAGDRVELVLTGRSDAYMPRARSNGMIPAVVQQVDATTALLRLRTMNGEIIEVQPSTQLFDSLQVGDSVAVSIRKPGAWTTVVSE